MIFLSFDLYKIGFFGRRDEDEDEIMLMLWLCNLMFVWKKDDVMIEGDDDELQGITTIKPSFL